METLDCELESSCYLELAGSEWLSDWCQAHLSAGTEDQQLNVYCGLADFPLTTTIVTLIIDGQSPVARVCFAKSSLYIIEPRFKYILPMIPVPVDCTEGRVRGALGNCD